MKRFKQNVSKCIGACIRDAGIPSFSIGSMSTAAKELREKFSKLVPDPRYVHKCKCCGKPKKPVEAAKGDVQRMFKQVKPQVPGRFFRHIRRNLEAKGLVCAYIERTDNETKARIKRAKGYKRARLATKFFTRSGVTSFTLAELEEILLGTSRLKYSLVGSEVVAQELGIAMGDSLSSIKAELCLHEREGWFLRHPVDYFSASETLQMRYADDVLSVSCTLCSKCLHRMCERIYKRPLRYGVEESGTRVSYLDLTIKFIGNHMRIGPLTKNRNWAVGASVERVKNRYHANVTGIATADLLRQWISAHLHSVNRSAKSTNMRRVHILSQVCELVHLGYSYKAIKAAFYSVQSPSVRRVRDIGIAEISKQIELEKSGKAYTKKDWEDFFIEHWSYLRAE